MDNRDKIMSILGWVVAIVGIIALSAIFVMVVDVLEYTKTGSCEHCLLVPYIDPSYELGD